MIDLTPLEVRQKKGDFRRAVRGYDPELVNDFLDLVADRMEELVKQNMDLSDSVHTLQEEVERFRKKEGALSEALMTAQKLREDARSHAEKEGDLLLREARLAADRARQEASLALAREEETLRQVRARRGQLVDSFRRLLERELGQLDVIEQTLDLESGESRSAPPTRAAATPSADAMPRAEAEAEPRAEPRAERRAEPAVEQEASPPSDAALEEEAEGELEVEPEPTRARPAAPAPEPTLEPLDIEAIGPLMEERPREYPRPGIRPLSRDRPSGAGAAPEKGEPEDGEDDTQEDWLKSLVEE